MTPPVLPRTDLAGQAAPLLAQNTFVAIVPATQDGDWAVATAWELARAVAVERRVALVDLHVERPALDARADASGPEGIVDAFEFGASLSHVATQQDIPSLHFVPVGTLPSSADAVWGHPRWERLRRGFEQEDALMLGYCPARALDHLATRPDGLILLAPRAAGKAPTDPAVTMAEESGIPVIAVVGDVPARAASSTSPSGPDPRNPSWQRRAALAGAAAAVFAVTGAAILWPRPSATAPVAESSSPSSPPSPPSPPSPAAPEDSLFYSAQVAAFNRLAPALAYADELAGPGRAALVTPVRVGRPGAVWYRVLAGVEPDARAARGLLEGLWADGLVERGQGTILRTPHTVRVAEEPDAAAARARVRGLRARGIPAYIVPGPHGRQRVLVGAYREPEQAALADSLLAAAGVAGSLVTRTGLTNTP